MATLFSKHNKLSDSWRLKLQYYLEISIFSNLLYFQYNVVRIITSCFVEQLTSKNEWDNSWIFAHQSPLYIYIYLYVYSFTTFYGFFTQHKCINKYLVRLGKYSRFFLKKMDIRLTIMVLIKLKLQLKKSKSTTQKLELII